MAGVARNLTGRVAIVGTDQAEIALRLVAEGATVVLVGHDADAAGALLAQIAADAGSAPAAGTVSYAGSGIPATAITDTGSVIGVGRAAFFRLTGPRAGGPSTRPTESELDALVEFVSSQWPAR